MEKVKLRRFFDFLIDFRYLLYSLNICHGDPEGSKPTNERMKNYQCDLSKLYVLPKITQTPLTNGEVKHHK